MTAQQIQPTALSTFTFPATGAAVRVVEIAGEPWFVAADVCRCLGLGLESGTARHTARLAVDEKRIASPSTLGFSAEAKTRGGLRSTSQLAFVSESGLYKLALRAHRSNPAAAAFQDWVTRDVLPAIRKTGVYVKGEEKIAQATSLDDLDAEGHGKPIRSLNNAVVAWLS